MGTLFAIALVVFLLAAGWWIYLYSGARGWTTERDPLGEPPVRMAALIAAIVVGVALVSTGGGGAEHTGAMQQGLDEGDDDGLLSSADGVSSAAAAEIPASDTTAAAARKPSPSPEPSASPKATASASATPKDDLPAYGKLVVRARKAAEARGAKIRWYPTVADEAREASERRSR